MLVSIALRPDAVHVDAAGRHEEHTIIGTSSVLEIEHQYGKLAIEGNEHELSLKWAPSEHPPPQNHMTVSYFRATDSLYYPEILIDVPGYVQTSRRAI